MKIWKKKSTKKMKNNNLNKMERGDKIIFKNKSEVAWRMGEYVSTSYAPDGRKYTVIYEKRKINVDECKKTSSWIINAKNDKNVEN